MDFHVDIYFEQRWEDLRLKHNSQRRVLVKDLDIYNHMFRLLLLFAPKQDLVSGGTLISTSPTPIGPSSSM